MPTNCAVCQKLLSRRSRPFGICTKDRRDTGIEDYSTRRATRAASTTFNPRVASRRASSGIEDYSYARPSSGASSFISYPRRSVGNIRRRSEWDIEGHSTSVPPAPRRSSRIIKRPSYLHQPFQGLIPKPRTPSRSTPSLHRPFQPPTPKRRTSSRSAPSTTPSPRSQSSQSSAYTHLTSMLRDPSNSILLNHTSFHPNGGISLYVNEYIGPDPEIKRFCPCYMKRKSSITEVNQHHVSHPLYCQEHGKCFKNVLELMGHNFKIASDGDEDGCAGLARVRACVRRAYTAPHLGAPLAPLHRRHI